MSRIGTSYAWWYNQKYDRSGHVFQGRFRSECVEDDAYLLTVVRYIHNNPVKAKIVYRVEDYHWSSIHAYYCGSDKPDGLIAPEFILGIIHEKKEEAIKRFIEFMQMENEDQCLDDQIKFTKTDGEVKVEIEALTEAAPERIVYVSCNPATLARDLKLITAHKYSVPEVQPVDLFPQTTHAVTE